MVSQSMPLDVPPWRPEFFIGGHPAFDLINTISHRLEPEIAVDRMDQVEKIASWCAYQAILTDYGARTLVRLCRPRAAAAALVASVRDLRAATATICDAIAAQETPPPDALSQVLSLSADAHVVLAEVPDDRRTPAAVSFRKVTANAIVAAMALLVLDAVFRLPRDRVRSCPRCAWLFFDSSKGGRRRWCSMKDCGNREKVSRHYWAKQQR